MVGYADDHILLTTIPHKDNRATAAAQLNADLAALCEYGHHSNIKFVPLMTFSLVVSLKPSSFIKPGARPKATCAWFLEIALVRTSVCVCLYVRPQGH